MVKNQPSSSQMTPGRRITPTVILLLFVVLATLYSLIIPLFEGNDEPWHYAYIQYLTTHKKLPRQPPEQYPHLARQEASQPPLYYGLAAIVTAWVDTADFATFLQENPFYSLAQTSEQDNQNHMIHTAAEQFPYRTTVLAVHLARLLSVLLGAGTVICIYHLTLLLFPRRQDLAIGAMLVTALTPSFLFSSALVSNDSLITFLSSLAALLLAKLWRHPKATRPAVLLGLVLGSAALTKLSGLLLWPLAGLGLIILSYQQKNLWLLVKRMIIIFGLAGLLCGWWYALNGLRYGDVTGLNQMLELVGRREPGFGLWDIGAEFGEIHRSYWALFGWNNIPMPRQLYWPIDLAILAALIGLALAVARAVRGRQHTTVWVLIILTLWIILFIISLIRWTMTTGGSQGRLLYPAIGAISILLTTGWHTLWSKRGPWLNLGLGVALLALSLYALFFVIQPAYRMPDPLSMEQVAEQVSQSTEIHFGDSITLLGYQIDRAQAAPGERFWVTTCWRGEKTMEEDYFVALRLLVEPDLVAGQKNSYHGAGNFPTSLWPSGMIFCDRYPLVVQDTTPASTQGTISIGLYQLDGQFLPLVSGGQSQDAMRFAGPHILLSDASRRLAYHWAHQVALTGYQLDKPAVYPGQSIALTLTWETLAPIATNYVATVQISDDHWNKIAQSDNTPLAEGTPMSAWEPGTMAIDRRTLQIPINAAPGVYKINIALYEPETIQNLTLYRDRQTLPTNGLLTLWTLRVLAGEP